jgi:hypothetical protein
MKAKNTIIMFLIVLVMLSACQQKPIMTEQPMVEANTSTSLPAETRTPTLIPEPTSTFTSAPSPTPTLPFEIPTPEEGKGTVVGLVLWGKYPVRDVSVTICNNFDKGFCQGKLYSGVTNEHGYYMFNNLDPDKYVITLNISSANIRLRINSDNSPYNYSVEAGKILAVEPRQIDKDNLIINSPGQEGHPGVGRNIYGKLVFKWEVYPNTTEARITPETAYFWLVPGTLTPAPPDSKLVPEAAYYELTLEYADAEFIADPVKVEGTEYKFDKPLPTCHYFWGVEAFDEAGNKISSTRLARKNTATMLSHLSTDFWYHSDVPDFSCVVTLESPKNNTEVYSAKGAEFSWKPNPMAAYYILKIKPIQEGNEEEFKVNDKQTNYKLDSIHKGIYSWSVEAYDDNDTLIATSRSNHTVLKVQ